MSVNWGNKRRIDHAKDPPRYHFPMLHAICVCTDRIVWYSSCRGWLAELDVYAVYLFVLAVGTCSVLK